MNEKMLNEALNLYVAHLELQKSSAKTANYGVHHDGGYSKGIQILEAYKSGLKEEIPEFLKNHYKQAIKNEDPEYIEYLRLKEKFQ